MPGLVIKVSGLILMEDLNLPSLIVNSEPAWEFMDTMMSMNLTQMVNDHSHWWSHDNKGLGLLLNDLFLSADPMVSLVYQRTSGKEVAKERARIPVEKD